MVAVKDPPLLPVHHIPRPALVAAVRAAMTGAATEMVAISGAGKTTLAAELINALQADGGTALYAPIRATTEFRAFLAGVGYVLRRYGSSDMFAIATRAGTTIT
jgi:ABC-type branched-subunit amino acid transport system ATPase component